MEKRQVDLGIKIYIEDSLVHVQFTMPIEGICLTPAQAMELAENIIKKAEEVEVK